MPKISTLTKLQYDSDCTFKEGIFANYWTTYSSLTWGLDRMQLSTWYMAINGRGHRVSAKKSKKSRPSAHFLPDPIEGKFIIINGLGTREGYRPGSRMSRKLN